VARPQIDSTLVPIGALTLLLAACILWLALGSRYVGRFWIIDGLSMAPTMVQGDWIWIDRWTLDQRRPLVGELVLFELPEDGRWVVKRVQRSSADAIWVLGDNPQQSLDSRQFGPISVEQIVGRVAWASRRPD
jgi:nickel-type superoxide dismutase maturation protease